MEQCPRRSPRRRFRRALRLSALMFLGAAGVVAAQESSATVPEGQAGRAEVFAPFVSRLKASAEGTAIVLTWRNSRDLQATKLVYRSRRPIAEDSFAAAELVARLDPTAARFEDTPPDQQGYFYAVLLEAPDGNTYRMFIPFRNVTSQEVQVASQESSATVPEGQAGRAEVFAPFVSRLKASAEGTAIVLTWRNSRDLQATKLVYRSRRPIAEDSFAAAELVARLDPTAARFEDTPPDQQGYFYAVLLEAPEGNTYRMFIPFRNVTSQEVQAAALIPEEQLAAAISGIGARVAGDSIAVQFKSSKGNRELLLFRSSSPIKDAPDLLEAAAPVSLGPGTTSYVDYPIPGIGYFYCVLDAGLFKFGMARPAAGISATAKAVEIPIGVDRVGLPSPATFRPIPLPFLLLSGGVESGEQLTPSPQFRLPVAAQPLTPATRAAVARILAETAVHSAGRRTFQLLEEDRRSEDRPAADRPASGPDPASVAQAPTASPREAMDNVAASRTLSDIANGALVGGDPAAAAAVLQNFLRIPRTTTIEHRARFYLGQMYYQTDRYREALLEFLLARDSYYRQAEQWLEDCLRRLWQVE